VARAWLAAAVVHSGGPQIGRRPGRVTNACANHFGHFGHFGHFDGVVAAGRGIGHPSLEPAGDLVEDGCVRGHAAL
jgi:hypothetical protein